MTATDTLIGADTVLALGPTATIQAVGDGVVVLLTDSGQIYTGNPTTEAVLRRVDGRRALSDLASSLCEEFDVGPQDALDDAIAIAGQLVGERILVVVG